MIHRHGRCRDLGNNGRIAPGDRAIAMPWSAARLIDARLPVGVIRAAIGVAAATAAVRTFRPGEAERPDVLRSEKRRQHLAMPRTIATRDRQTAP